jgi:CBS domain-containing protein
MTAPDSPARSPLAGVTVRDATNPGVVSCLPDDGVAKLASIMVAHGIHAVVLARGDRTGALVVTDLELVRAALERTDVHAEEIGREPLASLPADAPLDRAVAMMAERYVAHLLATDPVSGDPAGIISSFDVAAVLGGQDPKYAQMLRPGPARPSLSARTLAQARVGDAMHPGITTCPADAPPATVALSMAEHRVHCVAVAGVERSGHHLKWGLIGDMDLVRAVHRGAFSEAAANIAATDLDRRAGGRLARAGRRADGRTRHEPCGRRRALRPTLRNPLDPRRGRRLGRSCRVARPCARQLRPRRPSLTNGRYG